MSETRTIPERKPRDAVPIPEGLRNCSGPRVRLRIREHGTRDQGAWNRDLSWVLFGHISRLVPREVSVMTDRQVSALAAFLAEGRTDWQAPGIVAELRRQREHYDPWQLAAAMCKRAADPKNLTPQLQPFDREGFVGCRRHPTAGTRTDGRCGTCFAEAREAPSSAIRDRGGVAPSPEARALILAAVTHAELHPEAHT